MKKLLSILHNLNSDADLTGLFAAVDQQKGNVKAGKIKSQLIRRNNKKSFDFNKSAQGFVYRAKNRSKAENGNIFAF